AAVADIVPLTVILSRVPFELRSIDLTDVAQSIGRTGLGISPDRACHHKKPWIVNEVVLNPGEVLVGDLFDQGRWFYPRILFCSIVVLDKEFFFYSKKFTELGGILDTEFLRNNHQIENRIVKNHQGIVPVIDQSTVGVIHYPLYGVSFRPSQKTIIRYLDHKQLDQQSQANQDHKGNKDKRPTIVH